MVAVVAVLCVAAASLAGCGIGNERGIELEQLRTLARRVEGGGVECPLSVPGALIRPSTVARDTPVLPLRADGPGSVGKLGTGDPETGLRTKGAVTITCRYHVGDVAVRLAVAGVPKGHAIAELGGEFTGRGDAATVLTFIDVNGNLPIGKAAPLPGTSPAAFTRVTASTGDVALVLGVTPLKAGVGVPDAAEVEHQALAVARSLAN